jgi:hypothetical protein
MPPKRKILVAVGVLLLVCFPAFPIIEAVRTFSRPHEYVCFATLNVKGISTEEVERQFHSLHSPGTSRQTLAMSGLAGSDGKGVGVGVNGPTPDAAAERSNAVAIQLQQALLAEGGPDVGKKAPRSVVLEKANPADAEMSPGLIGVGVAAALGLFFGAAGVVVLLLAKAKGS